MDDTNKRAILAQFTDQELRNELDRRVSGRRLQSRLVPRCRNCIHMGFGPCKRTDSRDTVVCFKRVKEHWNGKTYYYSTCHSYKACDNHEFIEDLDGTGRFR